MNASRLILGKMSSLRISLAIFLLLVMIVTLFLPACLISTKESLGYKGTMIFAISIGCKGLVLV